MRQPFVFFKNPMMTEFYSFHQIFFTFALETKTSQSSKQIFHHGSHLNLKKKPNILFFFPFCWSFVWSVGPTHRHARAGCQRYPPPKVHSMCSNINYTKGQRCHKINVPLSVVQQAPFVLLSGILSIRQTRFVLLFFGGEAADFRRAPATVFLYVCGSSRHCSGCGGQNGHSVATDGQEKPRGGI